MELIMTSENIEIFFQLTLAVLLGGAIGFERRLAKKTAGIRTFALVALGATLFSIIPQIAFRDFIGVSSFDPSRVASQVVVGIGFLGAGLIIFQEDKLRGLTTAAGLWVAAAIGIAVGYQMYILAVFSTLLTILVLYFLWFVEFKLMDKFPQDRDE